MATLNLTVSNMSCGNCVKHVTNALSAINGVQTVDVDLKSGHVKVEGDLPADTNVFINALAEEGYPATLSNPASA